MTHLGLIAIVRGITPAQALDVGRAVHAAGFSAIEVPLNSPEPLRSIEILRSGLPEGIRVGAGTVLTEDAVDACADAGAELIVSPNTNTAVIARTVARGLDSFPGTATPSEAFAAIEAGAKQIKLFPGSTIGVSGMQAWASVLPAGIGLVPVGGVSLENAGDWIRGGAHGLGIGSSLFRPGMSTDDTAEVARRFREAWTAATS